MFYYGVIRGFDNHSLFSEEGSKMRYNDDFIEKILKSQTIEELIESLDDCDSQVFHRLVIESLKSLYQAIEEKQ